MSRLAHHALFVGITTAFFAATGSVHAFEIDPFSVKKLYSKSPAQGSVRLKKQVTVEEVSTKPLDRPAIADRSTIAESAVPADRAAADPCTWGAIHTAVDLLEVVERAMCSNSEARQAWVSVKIQAAQVGVAKAAYLPTAEANVSYSRGPNSYQVKDTPELSFNSKTSTRNIGVNANWVLFDFGLRRANLESARQLLIAANATQDLTLQKVFVAAAQAYYDLISAKGALNAFSEAEKTSGESFKAAEAKYLAGAGTLADKLQAQTDYAQARLDRVKALGDLRTAQGTLAIAMGVDANTPLTISADARDMPDTAFVTSIDQLIQDAKRTHPSLRAAQAQLAAANANVSAVRNEGLPSISLFGSANRNQQTGQPPAATESNNSSVGIQLKIPLFEGFGRTYRIRAAKAQAELKTVELESAEQQVSLEVWKNYQALTTETESLKATDDLQKSAQQSFDTAKGRYKAGVGNIIELLSAQSTLSKAQQQRVQALSNWHVARLKLASSLGRLGLWAL